MVASEVHPRFRPHGGQAGAEVQGLEDHMGGAISAGRFQLISDAFIGGQRQAFFSDTAGLVM